MKKLLLLPMLLLASCSMTPPTAPFKAGDTFMMSGNTKDKQNVALNVVLRDGGDLDGNYWEYSADGSGKDSAYLSVSTDLDYVAVVDWAEGADGSSEIVAACYAFPGERGWRRAEGRFLRMASKDYSAFWKRMKPLTGREFASELDKVAGDCLITRK